MGEKNDYLCDRVGVVFVGPFCICTNSCDRFCIMQSNKKGGLNDGFYYIFLRNVDGGNIDSTLFRLSG